MRSSRAALRARALGEDVADEDGVGQGDGVPLLEEPG
jgi:hypothetical protein